MSHRGLRRAFLLAIGVVICAPRVAASQDASTLLSGARAQIEEFAYDSAYKLLVRVLNAPGQQPTALIRAHTLFAINELNRLADGKQAARGAFLEALRLDPKLVIDSLAHLHSDAKAVFAAALDLAPPAIKSARAALPVAQATPPPVRADPMVPPSVAVPKLLVPVVVTREAAQGRSTLELPFAITTLKPDSATPGVIHTLVEQALAQVPGLTFANRNNPSQDTRVSIRGFGARSQFGVRSLRVMRDGMPLTLSDGQTPIDYLDLEAVSRVETIRGTASALYGNASGGVIDLRSGPPPSDKAALQLRSWGGSNGMRRNTALVGGSTSRFSYQGNVGRTTSDGLRQYAAQALTNAFLRATTAYRATDITLTGLGMDMPTAQNPGALTRIQYDTNATMADPQSILKKARKAVRQIQLGLAGRRPLRGDGDVTAQVFGSTRRLDNPLAFSVVGIDRATSGASVRATLPFMARQRVTFGVDAQRLSDARKNWANCNGVAAPTATCPTVGPGIERGNLTLAQREIVTSIGSFARDEFAFGKTLTTVGVRADNTKYTVSDAFTSDGRDDSGTRSMSAVSPMLGVAYRVAPLQSVYANVSTAFETPTTTEMVNKPDSSAGLNPDLDPQSSITFEIGAKGLVLGRVTYDAALFATNVRDELIAFDIGNGRNSFRNAGRTTRRGAEAGVGVTDVGPLAFNATYTFSRFRFKDYVLSGMQLEGRPIPGIPEQQAQVDAVWRHRLGFAVAEWVAKGRIFVNDTTGVTAPAYAVANIRAGANLSLGRRWLMPMVGIQNVFDRKHVASVAINAATPSGAVASGKFYEPGPGRTWFIGLTAATAPW